MPANEPRPDKLWSALHKYQNDLEFMYTKLDRKSARKRACFQAGGHIGHWPLMLSKHFARVYTFEPDPFCYAALLLNTEKHPNIMPIEGALGETGAVKEFSYYSGRSAVSTMVEVKDEGDLHSLVNVRAIDAFDEDVAAIVLDVEGYEPWVLRGARRTIERCRPLIVCEMLQKSADEIRSVLDDMDYVPVENEINRKCRDTLFMHRDAI